MLQIINNYNLKSFNSLGVDVNAAYFAEISGIEDLKDAIVYAKKQSLPLLVLGGGSNIVLSKDFDGLVLRINIRGIEVVSEDEDYIWVRAGAGENWHQFIEYCLKFHFWGLENLALIPGCVGAAPIQNIGAYGVELKEVFYELQAVEISSGVAINFDLDACDFSYRESVFKGRLKDQYIITSVTLKLFKEPQYNLSYPVLDKSIAEKVSAGSTLTPQLVCSTVCEIRSGKLPNPKELPNAGSFFKNPVVNAAHHQKLQKQYPELVSYSVDDEQVKLAAGWLIESAGWKGFREEGVGVHDKQALVIINYDNASGKDIIQLANRIQKSIKEKFEVELEIEPRLYP